MTSNLGSPTLEAVINLAKTCGYEEGHSLQVTRLALRLFDELQNLHNLSPDQKDTLQYAGILHDIGWLEGWKQHHKVSLRIILTTPLLPFSNKERLIIGSIARYHRKALPSPDHDHFAALEPEEQKQVEACAALLRVADGLDRTHQNRVREISCKITPKRILVRCQSLVEAAEENTAAKEKSDLLEQVFQRRVVFEWLVKE